MESFTNFKGQDHKMDFAACAYLFSPEQANSRGFIDGLDIRAVKKAFRKKVRQYHPDLHTKENNRMIARRQARFVKVKQSYDYLCSKLSQPNNPSLKQKTKQPVLIAVGGAKGGIGKSIFTSNLSVYLSQKGFKTVAADFDLGGANLHLYLGRPMIKKSINDFLTQPLSDIREILEPTRYGVRLIGGNSSCLGAANISFTRKLKLLRAIRSIDADYVIIDLGGDTSYNVLDFFLAADIGIVMTTCEPASYLEAYSFIKVALYRKLNRLYGVESMMPDKKDPILQKIIHQTTASHEDPLVGDIETLVERIKKEHPAGLRVIRKALNEFTPQLVVNKAVNETKALEPFKRIHQVSRKKLSIEVNYLCAFPFNGAVEKSARTLVPWMADQPSREMIHKLENIWNRILDLNQERQVA